MNILYLTKWNIDESSGVYKKIIAQKKALNRLGHQCCVLFVNDTNNSKLILNDGKYDDVLLTKDYLCAFVKKFDFCYVRFELLKHKFYRLVLNACKKAKTPVVLEIPTYPPYEESAARARNKLKEHKYFSALKTFLGILRVKRSLNAQIKLSMLVCNNGDPTIFKKSKTIRIENGIDFEMNPYINRTRANGNINIIAVSNFSVWNGYDLAIDGLNKYVNESGNRNIHLYFVGDKTKASDLINLTKKYSLEDVIHFTGLLYGDQLNEVYSFSNVALGGLGDHRRKAFTNSSLKAKEYAARGLIMILSESEGIENDIKEKSFLVEAAEKPVNFSNFLEWYSSINVEDTSSFIHNFASNYYSWDIQMEYVCDEFLKVLNGGKNNK